MSDLRRLLIVSEPGKDGVFVVVSDLIRHLHSCHSEITVDLAYSTRRELGGATELAREVREHGGEAIDLHISNSPEPADIPAARAILSLVRRRRPQVIHAHSSKAGALCRMLGMLPGFPPVVYTPHAYYGVARKGGAREMIFNAIEAVCGRVGITACCSSDERRFAADVLKIPPSRLVTIFNGVNVGKFFPADEAEKQALRAELGIPPDGRLLVTVGRDTPQKNYTPLYAALGRILASCPEMRFAHAGEGSVERVAALPEAARQRAHPFNYLAAPQKLMRAADGFILPSLYEGFSLSMIEALSCGTPTILSDAPGLQAIRELGFRWTIWLPAPGDNEEFVDAVKKGIADWLAGEAGPIAAQRALTCERLNQTNELEKMVELYRSRL
jgi:glycosyltransferase involved in cell wall biosynthesis